MRIITGTLAAALTVSASLFISAAHAAAASQPPFADPTSTGSCTIKKTEISASNSFDESASTSFVDLSASGSITFTQKRAGCVAGTFFANAGSTVSGDSVVLQVLLDGTACQPLVSNYFFANAGTDFSSHSAAFFCGANVGAGSHKIQVQYSSFLGDEVEFFQRTLEVTHS
ncbi:MAG TPA: hypothetical protein VHY79_17645 [Rhizomicrobium sp.]|nr:hypothetical protein [Rhizomicrobium sp.]